MLDISVLLNSPAIAGAVAVIIVLFSVWVVSVAIRDASIIDMFWGGGFAIIAATCLLVSENLSLPAIAIAALVILWGARLWLHLFLRWRREGEEDYRYQRMRAHHGKNFWWRSFFTVFTFQGVLMWLIAMPYMAALDFGGPAAAPLAAFIGLAVALAGVTMETLADIQLTNFRANAKPGDLLTDGWWSRTRHPNYFGDAMFWWGIWFAAVATTPEVIWTIYAPALMNFLIVKISGAAMLERSLIKKPSYEEYMARTNRFVPRVFPKRS
jgi:steroid 5-alpha reductase family enzyme